jgi:hypothetical protein
VSKKDGIDGDPNEDSEDSMFQAEWQVKIDRSDRNYPKKRNNSGHPLKYAGFDR